MRASLAAVADSTLLLAGCFPSAPVKAEYPDAEPALPANCLTPTKGAVAALHESIQAKSPDATIVRTGLVDAEESDLWYLAIEFHDAGLDREFTGIWASAQDLTTNEEPAFVSVDEVAEASSEYAQPADFDSIGVLLPSAEEAVDCLA